MKILITDTGSGFGHALAMEFLENGASVYGISRRSNSYLKKYKHYHHLTHDLINHQELNVQLKNFLARVKTLDLVILNAGILFGINDIRKTSIEDIVTVMNVNLLANKVIIDTLLETVSHVYQIVAISSGSAIKGSRGWNAFALSKAALNTLIKLYAREIPETHFSALEPGIVDTDLHETTRRLTEEDIYPVARELKRNGMNSNGNLSDQNYAANYLVEAMGIILQEESGTYRDVRDILLTPELVS